MRVAGMLRAVAAVAGGAAEGYGKGKIEDIKLAREEAWRKMQLDAAAAESEKDRAAKAIEGEKDRNLKAGEGEKDREAALSRVDKEIGSRERVAGMDRDAATARTATAYREYQTDEATGQRYYIDQDGKQHWITDQDGKIMTGPRGGEAKLNTASALAAAAKGASSEISGEMNWDTFAVLLKQQGVEPTEDVMRRAKEQVAAAEVPPEAKKEPGFWSKLFGAGKTAEETKSVPEARATPGETPKAEATSGYKTPDDVLAAYRENRITRVEAARILREDFGHE